MENIINDIIHTISPRAGRAKCWLYPLEPRSTNSKSRNFYKDYRSHLFIRLYSFKYLQGIAWVECLRERTHGLRTYNIDF